MFTGRESIPGVIHEGAGCARLKSGLSFASNLTAILRWAWSGETAARASHELRTTNRESHLWVALYVLAIEIAHRLIPIFGTSRAEISQQLLNGIHRHASHAHDAAKGVCSDKSGDDLHAFFCCYAIDSGLILYVTAHVRQERNSCYF